jgi:hypothetical protein
MTRTFESTPAVRTEVPLLAGIVGPSGGGKTFSALRLATGMQRVRGGDIHVIDTEAGRAKHYAEEFRFHHTPFEPPFSSADYLAAIQHCAKLGASIIIVDSMSHEHEGAGGMLEAHAAERSRLAKLWNTSEKATDMTAWGAPKAERARMVQGILQLPIALILCWRAKDKIKLPKKGSADRDPIAQGYTAIAGEELLFEMTANFLLLPRADGVPVWDSEFPGELASMKLPRQFRSLFAKAEALSEEHGEAMARWAAGRPVFELEAAEFDALLKRIADAAPADLKTMPEKIEAVRRQVTVAQLTKLREAFVERKAALKKPDAPAATKTEELVQEEPGANG